MKITIKIQGGTVYSTCRPMGEARPKYSWIWGGLEYSFASMRDGKRQYK